eukprot:Opistho-2@30913
MRARPILHAAHPPSTAPRGQGPGLVVARPRGEVQAACGAAIGLADDQQGGGIFRDTAAAGVLAVAGAAGQQQPAVGQAGRVKQQITAVDVDQPVAVQALAAPAHQAHKAVPACALDQAAHPAHQGDLRADPAQAVQLREVQGVQRRGVQAPAVGRQLGQQHAVLQAAGQTCLELLVVAVAQLRASQRHANGDLPRRVDIERHMELVLHAIEGIEGAAASVSLGADGDAGLDQGAPGDGEPSRFARMLQAVGHHRVATRAQGHDQLLARRRDTHRITRGEGQLRTGVMDEGAAAFAEDGVAHRQWIDEVGAAEGLHLHAQAQQAQQAQLLGRGQHQTHLAGRMQCRVDQRPTGGRAVLLRHGRTRRCQQQPAIGRRVVRVRLRSLCQGHPAVSLAAQLHDAAVRQAQGRGQRRWNRAGRRLVHGACAPSSSTASCRQGQEHGSEQGASAKQEERRGR